jgi:perosamine synthetase
MLVTDDTAHYERCLFLRDHGRPAGDRLFHNTEVAFKYKMSSMQAALGLAQLERIEELVARKRQIFGWYCDELGDKAGITLNSQGPGVTNTYWMVTAVLDPEWGIDKMALMARMADKDVDCRPFFHPLSSLPAYAYLPHAADCREENVVAYGISPWAINLPSALELSEADVKAVCERLTDSIAELRNAA